CLFRLFDRKMDRFRGNARKRRKAYPSIFRPTMTMQLPGMDSFCGDVFLLEYPEHSGKKKRYA
ncbi:MAG: hypothetical protein IJO10_07375, partial [Clostridia bacterium]|nr:hypothetical protein [Clostridia bacterium]